MKKILLILAIAGALVSCTVGNEAAQKAGTKTVAVNPQSDKKEQTIVAEKAPITIDMQDASKVATKKNKIVKENNDKQITTETSVDKVVDGDVDKKITKTEIETKTVEAKPIKEEKSHKSLYGAIAVIIVAAGAVVAFKKK